MLGFMLPLTAHAHKIGDWVLGNYQGNNYWFAGVISEIGRGQVTIRYDDGDVEVVSSDHVKPYDWQVGTGVECNFRSAGKWYPGKITGLNGTNLAVAYDDGDKEQTKTGLCRSR